MGEALLIREANRRAGLGDPSAARHALDAVLDRGSRDPLVWYSAGQAYEKAGGLDQAEHCYLRGVAAEEGTAWAVGRYYLGVLYFKQDRWPRVIETLEPLTRGPIEARIRNSGGDELSRLADWSGAFLLLGIAHEHSGRTDDAKNLYQRLLAAQVGSREWKVNRALVSLAALEGRDGANLEASQHFSRALDLTFSYPASFREEYQADTWRQLLEFVRIRVSAGDVDRLLPAARAVVDATPRSPGAWLILALAGTAACQDEVARDAYQRAEALDSAVSPFRGRLEEARAKPIWPSCRPQ
jgi:tetratricopeptide (TPR) repeat protein